MFGALLDFIENIFGEMMTLIESTMLTIMLGMMLMTLMSVEDAVREGCRDTLTNVIRQDDPVLGVESQTEKFALARHSSHDALVDPTTEGVVWCGEVWCGAVCCGVVRCGGVVWCGVVWCGVVLFGVV